MSFRRRPLRRLDLLVLGASPDKLAQKDDIPAVIGPALSTEQSDRLYKLNYKHEHGARPLSGEEQLEREQLRIQLIHPRRF